MIRRVNGKVGYRFSPDACSSDDRLNAQYALITYGYLLPEGDTDGAAFAALIRSNTDKTRQLPAILRSVELAL